VALRTLLSLGILLQDTALVAEVLPLSLVAAREDTELAWLAAFCHLLQVWLDDAAINCRVGFWSAKSCFCHSSGLNWFKVAKTWFELSQLNWYLKVLIATPLQNFCKQMNTKSSKTKELYCFAFVLYENAWKLKSRFKMAGWQKPVSAAVIYICLKF